MTTTDALLEIAKTLHHLANTIELSIVAPGAELIPTDDDSSFEDINKKETIDHGITLERIRTVLQQKSRSGLRNEVNNLILAFGVTQLSDVPYEKYPELLLAAEEM